jgi:uncharacterized protein (TIGR02246 family)
MKTLVMILVLAVSGSALAQPKPAAAASDPKAAVQDIWDKVAAAFDKSDAKAFAQLWTEDGELINPGGVIGHGREGIAKVVGGDMATLLKGGKNKFTVQSVRVISPDAVWVDGDHDVTGIKGPDGKEGLHVHFVGLLVRKAGQWWIAEARPYMFLPPPSATAKK